MQHLDKEYINWLKYIPQRKQSDGGSWNRGFERKNSGSGRASNSGDMSGRKSASDADDWRKNKTKDANKADDKEVTSPLKLPTPVGEGGSQKRLVFHGEEQGNNQVPQGETPSNLAALGAGEGRSMVDLPMPPVTSEKSKSQEVVGAGKPKIQARYQRKGRKGSGKRKEEEKICCGGKRGA